MILKNNIIVDNLRNDNNTFNIDVYNGFYKGNIFNKLYDPYKTYIPTIPKVTTREEQLLLQISNLTFNLVDLNLYLDVYPNDVNALNLYTNINKQLQQLEYEYEKKFQIISTNSQYLEGTPWKWLENPWPWEGSKKNV